MLKSVHAYLLLAWHFFLHVLKKVFFLYDRGGIERFRGHFDREGLAPLSKDEREMLAQWQSCIGCGLCEAVSSDLSVIPEQRHMGPSLLAQGGLRDLSESDLTLPSADAVEHLDCGELQGICPVDIPLCDLAKFLSRIGEETHEARSGGALPEKTYEIPSA